MKMTKTVSLSIFLIFVLMGVVTAASLPTDNPFRVEGSFTIDGGAPTQDYTFTGKVNGELYKSIETGADGNYVITVGGYDGDEVTVYIEGVLICTAEFESYGTYVCEAVDIAEPEEQDTDDGTDDGTEDGTSDGGSSGGSSGGSGSTSGGSSGGGGSSRSSTTEEEEETTSTLDEEEGVDLLMTNVTEEVVEEPAEGESNGLAGITGAAIVDGIQDFGVGKSIFVALLVLVAGTGAFLFFKKTKKEEVPQAEPTA